MPDDWLSIQAHCGNGSVLGLLFLTNHNADYIDRVQLIYCEYWIRLRDVLDEEPIPTCNVLRLWRFDVLYALAKNPKSIVSFFPTRPKVVSCNGSSGNNCPCRGTTYPWFTKLLEKRNAIPKFSSIILEE